MRTIARLLSPLAVCGVVLGVLAAGPATRPATQPALTDAEKQTGWKLLFDGKTTAGWRKLGGGEFPKEQWGVDNGCLRKLAGKGGDLIYEKPFENFELSFEWMVPKPKGNSGVKYRVQEKQGNSFAYGPEYQLMNDGDVSDKGATGSLYELFPPQGKKLNAPPEFNHSRIVVRGGHIEHWLNGVKVVECEFGSDPFKAAVAGSKFRNDPSFGRPSRGYVALQDHGDEVWFRNIKAREL